MRGNPPCFAAAERHPRTLKRSGRRVRVAELNDVLRQVWQRLFGLLAR